MNSLFILLEVDPWFLGDLTELIGAATVIIEFAMHRSTNEWFSSDRNLMVLGAALSAVGVAFLIYYFVARRTMQHEIEAEEHEAKMRKNV